MICNDNSIKKNIQIQCYVCGSMKDDAGQWDGVKREVIRTGNVSHCPCPECFPAEMKRINGEANDFITKHPELLEEEDPDIILDAVECRR